MLPEIQELIQTSIDELTFKEYECEMLMERLKEIRKTFNRDIDEYRRKVNQEIDVFYTVIEKRKNKSAYRSTSLQKAHDVLHEEKKKSDWRETILIRDRFKCQKCGSGFDLTVHHVIPKSLCSEEMMWDTNNGITLCKGCHHQWHTKFNLDGGINIFIRWLHEIY